MPTDPNASQEAATRVLSELRTLAHQLETDWGCEHVEDFSRWCANCRELNATLLRKLEAVLATPPASPADDDTVCICDIEPEDGDTRECPMHPPATPPASPAESPMCDGKPWELRGGLDGAWVQPGDIGHCAACMKVASCATPPASPADLPTLLDAAGERESIAALLADRTEATVYQKVEGLLADYEKATSRSDFIRDPEDGRPLAERTTTGQARMDTTGDATDSRTAPTEGR